MDTEDADLDRVLSVNFRGVLHACQEAARTMIAHGIRGSIVTMASGAVDSARPGLFCYSVSKARSSSSPGRSPANSGPHKIRVNAVAPGWIRTPMTEQHAAGSRSRWSR